MIDVDSSWSEEDIEHISQMLGGIRSQLDQITVAIERLKILNQIFSPIPPKRFTRTKSNAPLHPPKALKHWIISESELVCDCLGSRKVRTTSRSFSRGKLQFSCKSKIGLHALSHLGSDTYYLIRVMPGFITAIRDHLHRGGDILGGYMVWLWWFWWLVIFVGIVSLSILGYAWGFYGWRVRPLRIAGGILPPAGDTTWSDLDNTDEARRRGWLTVLFLCIIMIITLFCFIVGAYWSMWGPYTYPKTIYTSVAHVTPGSAPSGSGEVNFLKWK